MMTGKPPVITNNNCTIKNLIANNKHKCHVQWRYVIDKKQVTKCTFSNND